MRLVIFDPAGNPHYSLRHQLLECPLTARRQTAYCAGPLELFDRTGEGADAALFADAVVVTFAYAYPAVRALLGGAAALVVVDKQSELDPLDLMELGMGGLRVTVVETSTALTPTICAALGLAPREFLDS